ncbi:MAG: type I-U CRISPR-associated helicase/endonuclease Cas3, partial [Bryobacteraceae bacterium]
GTYRNINWADEPNQPLVCVSTVDQVGSRLLFRGYQVSDSAKPVHAALVGNDSLIIVDEAHLSAPFIDTLATVQSYTARSSARFPGIDVVQMSATLKTAKEPFRIGPADEETPELIKRLAASKSAELRAPEKGFETEVARAARELSLIEGVSVVGVVVNTVASARAVFEELRAVRDAEAILLTGRNRPYCSQQLWANYKARIAANRESSPAGRLFVVATQTIEVGANLDFDALVSESAPLDALRQRFGRQNRLGKVPRSQAIIVRRPGADPVYGETTAEAWKILADVERVDFGVLAMNAALSGRDVTRAVTASSEGPLILPAYLKMWAQTNPRPDPDPDVAPFLHGKNALEDADVQLLWRADLEGDKWEELLALAPPLPSECLPLPISALRKWLRGERKMDVADVEGIEEKPKDTPEPKRETKSFLIWRGASSTNKISSNVRDIRPGDVVVVPSHYGGCDEFGWHPQSNHDVEDIGDRANRELADKGVAKRRVRLRLFAANELEDDSAAQKRFLKLCDALTVDSDNDSNASAADEIRKILQDRFEGDPRIDDTGQVAIWSRTKIESQPNRQPDDEEDDSVGQQEIITLGSHTAGVVRQTCLSATHCGLSPELVHDLSLAAELHDLGKWDDRFQMWLAYCDKSPTAAWKYTEPLAKSGGNRTVLERRTARRRAQYPDGARHESGSVLLACASRALDQANDRDLVIHLIGTHHGFGRPQLPTWNEDEAETISASVGGKDVTTGTGRRLGRIDSGWIDRFARLNQRYGYWGLAYLEAILRRADSIQSREEQTR